MKNCKYAEAFITYLVKLFSIDILRHCLFENIGDDAQLAMQDVEDVRLDLEAEQGLQHCPVMLMIDSPPHRDAVVIRPKLSPPREGQPVGLLVIRSDLLLTGRATISWAPIVCAT
jgi:hypothetical protein